MSQVTVTRLSGSVSIVRDDGKEIVGPFSTDDCGWMKEATLTKNTTSLSDEAALDLLKAAADEYTIGGDRTVIELDWDELLEIVDLP